MNAGHLLKVLQEKENVEFFLNAIPSGVFVLDAKTQEIIEANSAAIKMVEASKDEIIGQKYTEFFSEISKSDEKKTDSSGCVLLTKTGKEKYISRTRTKTKFKKRVYFLESFVDITEQTLVEKKLCESENTFKTIINQSVDGITVADIDGNYTLVNLAFCEMVGYSQDELLQMSVFDVKVEGRDKNTFARLKKSQKVIPIQVLLERKDGSKFMAEVLGKRIIIEGREHVLGIVRNVAERNRMQRLQSTLYRISQASNHAHTPEAFYAVLHEIISENMIAENFYIALYNERSDRMYMVYMVDEVDPSPHVIVRKGVTEYVYRTGETLLCTAPQLEAMQKSGEIELGGLLPALWLGVPLSTDGKVIGVMAVQRYKDDNVYGQEEKDLLETISSSVSNAISRQLAQAEILKLNIELEKRVDKRTKELAQRIASVEKLNLGMLNMMDDLNAANAIAERNARKLEAVNEELEAFSYSVSHDLRAPLRHIESFTELLNTRLAEKLDEKSSHYINTIVESTVRMRALIEDLLTLSRTSRADLHIKVLDFNGIIESVRANLLDEVSKREIVWRVARLPLAQADAGLMKILWSNLIENAVKYTRTRAKAAIEIGTLPSDDALIFFIRDNGVGFSPEYKEQLFNVFQRLHKNDEFEGSGVGLATVKRIIDRHKGEIWAEGEIDKGATFYFSLGTTEK